MVAGRYAGAMGRKCMDEHVIPDRHRVSGMVDDPVPATIFRFIKCLIGTLEYIHAAITTAKQGDTDGDGDLYLVILEAERDVLDHILDFFKCIQETFNTII